MKWATVALAILLAGCATIIEGRTQEVFMNVTPLDAQCTAFRRGEEVGRYSPVTRSMHVPKSRREMRISCTASGYDPAEITASSTLSAWSVVSFLFIDLGITDFATGALKKYPASITIVMRPEGSAATRPYEPPATTGPPSDGAFPPLSSSGSRDAR